MPDWLVTSTLAALGAVDALPTFVPYTFVAAAAAAALVAAAFHVAWAARGIPPSLHVLPERPETGEPFQVPPPPVTLAVAVVLTGFVATVTWVALGTAPARLWWTLAVGAGVLALRACGDGRIVGLFKRVRTTEFSRRDDAFYTPVVVLLLVGALSALYLAGLP